MESVCSFELGLIFLMKSISKTKQSKFLRNAKASLIAQSLTSNSSRDSNLILIIKRIPKLLNITFVCSSGYLFQPFLDQLLFRQQLQSLQPHHFRLDNDVTLTSKRRRTSVLVSFIFLSCFQETFYRNCLQLNDWLNEEK